MGNRDDKELLAKLRQGDEAAFAELLSTHHRALRRLARMFVSSDALADEVVQETWLAVLDGLRSFEERSSLKTWISRILVNRAKSKGEREGRTVPFSALGDADEAGDPAVEPARFDGRGTWSQPPEKWEEGTPEKLLLRKEVSGILEEALTTLPERQRAVVTLRDVEGWTSEEVCNVLEINETNQRVLLHRGRSRLRTRLEQYMMKR